MLAADDQGVLSVTQVPDNSPSPAAPLPFCRKHVPGDLRSCQPTSSFLWFERRVGERNDKGTGHGMPWAGSPAFNDAKSCLFHIVLCRSALPTAPDPARSDERDEIPVKADGIHQTKRQAQSFFFSAFLIFS